MKRKSKGKEVSSNKDAQGFFSFCEKLKEVNTEFSRTMDMVFLQKDSWLSMIKITKTRVY